jgi:hypothetical protein
MPIQTNVSVTALNASHAAFESPEPAKPALHFPLTSGAPERFAFNINDASIALSISRSSLYVMIKTGEITMIKIAGRSLVPRSEIERLTRILPAKKAA